MVPSVVSWSMLISLERDKDTSLSYFANCILHGWDTQEPFNVLGHTRFVGLLEDWITSYGLQDKLADFGGEWEWY